MAELALARSREKRDVGAGHAGDHGVHMSRAWRAPTRTMSSRDVG